MFGGYNREGGTMDTIEKYAISDNRWTLCNIRLPIPLRRFVVVRIKLN
jgi:hypothetical protein